MHWLARFFFVIGVVIGVLSGGVLHAENAGATSPRMMTPPAADRVIRVGFLPGEKQIFTQLSQGPIVIWDVASGKTLHVFDGSVAAISPDGKTVAVERLDLRITLFDTASGEILRRLDAHKEYMTEISFASDNKSLLSCDDESIYRWNLETGKVIWTGKLPARELQIHPFTADGKGLILARKNNILECWNLSDSKLAWTYDGQKRVEQCWIEPGSNDLAVRYDPPSLCFLDAATGKMNHEYADLPNPSFAKAVSRDHKLLAVGLPNNVLRLCDAESGKQLRELEGPGGTLLCAEFSADGKRLLAAGEGESVQLWDSATGKLMQEFKLSRHDLMGITLTPDGTSLAYLDKNSDAVLWDIAGGKQRHIALGNKKWIWLRFSPDGKKFLYRLDEGPSHGSLRLIDTASGKLELSFFDTKHSPSINDYLFSPDGSKAVLGTFEGTITICDATNARTITTFAIGHSGLCDVVMSPSGEFIAVSDFHTNVELWDVKAGKAVHKLGDAGSTAASMQFSADGKELLVALHANIGLIWDVKSGKTVQQFKGHSAYLSSAVFSRDQKRVLTSSYDHTARLWDRATGKELQRFESAPWIYYALFTADDTRVLTIGNDRYLYVWDAESGKKLGRIAVFLDGGWAVIGEDGRYDSSDSGDNKNLHWASGQEVFELAKFKEKYFTPGLLADLLKTKK